MAVQITLNRNGVAAPVQRAAMVSIDIVAAALSAFAEGDLLKPTMPNEFITFEIRGPEITSNERPQMYQSWLLSKGFQDLARGVRESLEEAALYLSLIFEPIERVRSSANLQDVIENRRRQVAGPLFPKLLTAVNARLTSPIEFEQEFLSIQRVRNCLEHRGGTVGRQDLDEGGAALTLSFPRHKFFYLRHGEEVELERNHRVDDGSGGPDVQIFGKIVNRSKTYHLDERIVFTPSEFSEIAMACSLFGSQLAALLPDVKV